MRGKELIGVDEVIFALARSDLPHGFVFEKKKWDSPLMCRAEFMALSQRDGKIFVSINLPRFLRKTNKHPFRVSETRACGEMVSYVLSFLSSYGLENAQVQTAEVNLTLNVAKYTTTDQVLRLFNYCFDKQDYGKSFAAFSSVKRLGLATHTKRMECVKTQKSADGSHLLKIYDKNEQLGIVNGQELLRIEMVIQRRELFRLFEDRSLEGIINDDGINKLVGYFCKTWMEYTAPRINKYRKGVQKELERQLALSAERCSRGFAFDAFTFVSGYYFLDADVLKRGISAFCRKTGRRSSQTSIYNNLITRYDFIPSGIDDVFEIIKKICTK